MKKILSLFSLLLIAVSLFTLTAHAETAQPTTEIQTELPTEEAHESPSADATLPESPSSNLDAPTSDPADEKAIFSLDRLSWSIPMALEGFGVTILAMCVIIIVVIITNKALNALSKKSGDQDDQQ